MRVLEGSADRTSRGEGGVAMLPPGALLSYDLVVVALLLGSVWAVGAGRGPLADVPGVVGGVFPLLVTVTGALGGVTKSVGALASHWDLYVGAQGGAARRRWNAWHLTRPVAGALFGTAATMIALLVIGTVGTTAGGAGVDVSSRGVATLAVVSFVIGYQQDAFRRLVDRLLDLVLGPGDPDQPATPAPRRSGTDAGPLPGDVRRPSSNGSTDGRRSGTADVALPPGPD